MAGALAYGRTLLFTSVLARDLVGLLIGAPFLMQADVAWHPVAAPLRLESHYGPCKEKRESACIAPVPVRAVQCVPKAVARVWLGIHRHKPIFGRVLVCRIDVSPRETSNCSTSTHPTKV